MFLALVKVRKKDFCIVLARKQEKCSNRAPLTPPTKTASFPEGIAFKSQSDMLPPFQHFSTSCLNQCFHAVPVYNVIMHKLLSLLEWFGIIFPLHQIPTTQICNELTFICHFTLHTKTATVTLQGLEDQGNLSILIWKI